MVIKIFYKIVPKSIEVDERDIGIFVDKIRRFKGKQYSLKEYKMKNTYKYQRFFADFANTNREFFHISNINIENACNLFFIRTYDSLGIESLGNILTLIDILDEASKKNNFDSEKIVCYVPNEDIKYIFKQFFENKKIKNYEINVGGDKFLNLIKSKMVKFLGCFYYFRILFRWLFGNMVKRKNNGKICFISPLGTTTDIHKNAKDTLLKMNSNFDDIVFDTKNQFFKNFSNIRYYKNTIYSIKKSKSIYIGKFLKFSDIIYILKKHWEKMGELKNLDINYLNYENIMINIENFLNLYVHMYLIVIIESILIVEKLLRQYDVILYSYNDDPLLEMLNTMSPRDKKIISLQYELISPGCAYYFYNEDNENIELVWNEYSKRVLEEYYNYPKNKVFVVGNIRFKKIQKIKNNNKKLNVVFTAQDAVFPEVLDMFLSSVKKVNNDHLNYIIKPHPADNMNKIHKKIEKMELCNKIKVISDPIDKVLEITDVLVSYSSTTLLEANYNNIPCIVINPYNTNPPGVPIYHYVPYFKDEEEFSKFLKILNRKKLEEVKIPKILKINEFDDKLFRKILFS